MRGFTKKSSIHKSLLRVGTNQIDEKLTKCRLCPINGTPKGQTLYDTIAFLIFCPKHRNIAVCKTYDSNREISIWLPFIYLSNKVSTKVAIEDGLCVILSDNDLKLLFKYKEEKPFQTTIIDTMEVYFPKTNKSVHRIICWADIHSNTPGFQCCPKTSRINWKSVTEVCTNIQDQIWRTPIHMICRCLRETHIFLEHNLLFIVAPSLYRAKNYYQNYTVITAEDYLLNSLGITRKQIDLLFIDFYEHCFPSISMSFLSFVDYLSKYGFRETNTKMRRIFNTFQRSLSNKFYCSWPNLKFEDFLMGLAYIDKDSPHDRSRLLFVFNYYDSNRKRFLSEDDFREMVTDIHKNEGQEEIDRIVADGMTGIEYPKFMNRLEFINRAKTHEFGDATHLGKCEHNLLKIIYNKNKAKNTRPIDTLIKNLFEFHSKN